MRIVVVGDFHIKSNELELTEKAIEDIGDCSPDLVIPLGDFGDYEKIGSPAGIAQAANFFSSLGVNIRPILGNHDLERESGKDDSEQGVIQKEFKKIFKLDQTYGVIEYDTYRLIFMSTDPQPKDSCYEVQECYVSDEQFDWLVNTLGERPDTPVIMFTHAPPVGAGLRTVPDVHVRATNAYLDQNHDPYRWTHLIENYPQIVMWFSTHFHLSHYHNDSHVENYGTTFFTTGVHGSCTRDSKRQSRIIDIEENRVSVSTLDHTSRKVLQDSDWSFNDPLRKLIDHKKKNIKKASHLNSDISEELSLMGTCTVGNMNGEPSHIIPLKEDRYLVATKDGFLWELDTEYNAVLGTYHIGEPLTDISYSNGYIWKAWDQNLVGVPSNTPLSYVRRYDEGLPDHVIKMPDTINAIAPDGNGGILVCSGKSIYKINKNVEPNEALKPIASLNEEIIQIKTDQNQSFIQTLSGDLYLWNGSESKPSLLVENITAWDFYQNRLVALQNNDSMMAVSLNTMDLTEVTIDIPSIDHHESPKLICFAHQSFIIVLSGEAMLWNGEKNKWHTLDTSKRKVVTLARSLNNQEFLLGLDSKDEEDFPIIQTWKIALINN